MIRFVTVSSAVVAVLLITTNRAEAPVVEAVPVTTTQVIAPVVVQSTPVRGTQVQVMGTLPPPTTLPGWDGPLPAYYGGDTACTRDEASTVARAMWARGASNDTVEWMLKTISRESTCDSAAYNGNRNTGDNSYGLCQINTLAGFFKTGQILADFDYTRFASDFSYNAEACAKLWSVCGRGPWNYGNYYCEEPKE